MNHHVLVVDDDPDICRAVADALSRYEFEVACVNNAEAAKRALEEQHFDLVTLDIGLPGQSGTDFCREFRSDSDIPVIFLTGYDADMDRIVGLEIGADDYITKPFHPGVLLARARAVLRRSSRGEVSQPASEPTEHRLVMDEDRYDAAWDEEYVGLSKTEFDLLKALMRRPGKVYSRDDLRHQAYGPLVHVSDKTINSHVTRIRDKLKDFEVDPIESCRGVGYRIVVELILAIK